MERILVYYLKHFKYHFKGFLNVCYAKCYDQLDQGQNTPFTGSTQMTEQYTVNLISNNNNKIYFNCVFKVHDNKTMIRYQYLNNSQ